jgi:murein DD-endopeptidase MepM/ murein hydrolase activator NlpD
MSAPGKGGRAQRDSGRRSKALLELQIHPQDIRKKVRYLFLSRRAVNTWMLGLAAYLLLVAVAAAVAPGVIGDLLRRREHRALLAEREMQVDRLESQIGRLEELGEASDELRLAIDKIFLLYGLSSDVTGGQGGYPFLDRTAAEAEAEAGERLDPLDEAQRLEAAVRESLSVASIFLGEIQQFEGARTDLVRLTPSRSPLARADFVLTSPFGNRRNPFTKERDFHAGLDMAARTGTEILAPADGVVLFAGRYSLQRSVAWWLYGNMVILGHGEHFLTVYGHCTEVLVAKGDRVSQGEPIATVGSTGMSTSPHLHYEIRRMEDDGGFRPVDPRIYILDHKWRDEERILVRSRTAPPASDFQPLPPLAGGGR